MIRPGFYLFCMSRATVTSTCSLSWVPSTSPRRSLTGHHRYRTSCSTASVPINKTIVASKMSPELYEYLLHHTREPQVLKDLRGVTAGMSGSQMQVSPEQGQFMSLMVELMGVKKALEVGVYTGYSSLAVAMALPPDGVLIALDKDPVSWQVAQEWWKKAGVEDKVQGMLGPAEDSLKKLLAEGQAGTFDMAFLDADKRAYMTYYELLLQLIRPGGLIMVDNVLWYGKVADLQVHDKPTVALREFNDFILQDERISLSVVPVGDGIAMCRKR